MQINAAGGSLSIRKQTSMKKAVRKLFLVLSIILIIPFLWGRNIHAEETVVISAGSAEGDIGDKIIIPVDIRNSKKVATLDITVLYDADELSFVDAVSGGSVKDGNICSINPMPEKACIRFVFTSLKEIPADGNVMELTFQVLRDDPQEHTVDVHVIDVFDMDIEPLVWTTEGGREIEPKDPETVQGGQDQNPETAQDGQMQAVETQQDGRMKDSETVQDGQTQNLETGQDRQTDIDGDSGLRGQKESGSKSSSDRRFFAKTKDGIKDVTDTAANRTGENLLEEGSALGEVADKESEISDTGSAVTAVVCAVIILVMITAGVIIYRVKKKK